MAHQMNVLALVKGEERYIYAYDDESRRQLIDVLRDHAASPQVSLTWFDALVLTRKAREQESAQSEQAVDLSSPDLSSPPRLQ